MDAPDSPHLVRGEGTQVGLITLWTKKEHVLAKVPEDLYALAGQLYSRDEGLSLLLRTLFKHPSIRDLVIVGADLNDCAQTLLALWKNGVEDGRVQGAPGYVDTEIPASDIDELRRAVKIHDLRSEKDYAEVAEYIQELPDKDAWSEPREYPQARIEPPDTFPTAHQHALRADSIRRAAIDLAHRQSRFGPLHNVQVHLTARGKLPAALQEHEEEYTANVLEDRKGAYGEHLHRHGRLDTLTRTLAERDEAAITFGDDAENPLLDLVEAFRTEDGLHLSAHTRKTTLGELPLLASALFALLEEVATELDAPARTVTISTARLDPAPKRLLDELSEKPHVLRRTGDPRSNVLIRVKDERIHVTHLSPDGKRLEEFTGEDAMELYKRLVVEHRITDLSHAAYLGYELARAQEALRSGGMYEQDARD